MQSSQPTSPPVATTVYLGLGSNLGDRRALIEAAVDALGARGALQRIRLSGLYQTDAVADEPQPPYLNAVVRGDTGLSPAALLAVCLDVEAGLGRVRPPGQAKASRTIDIDILLYGQLVIDGPALTVPHPAMLARDFVLVPLGDVAEAGLCHPVTGVTLAPPSVTVSARAPRRLYPPPTRG